MRVGKVWGLVSSIFSALGLLNMIQDSFKIGFLPVFQNLVDAWDRFLSLLFYYVEPVIISAIDWIGWKVVLYSHWKHILVLMVLYFLTHARMALGAGNTGAAIWNASWGALVAVAAGIIAGMAPLDGMISSLLIPAAAILGVSLYTTGNSVRAATFFRQQGQQWSRAFKVPFRHALRFLLFGLTVLTLALCAVLFGGVNIKSFGIMLLIVLFLALAIYRVYIGPRWGWVQTNMDDSWWKRAKSSNESAIGVWMLLILIETFGVIAATAFFNLNSV